MVDRAINVDASSLSRKTMIAFIDADSEITKMNFRAAASYCKLMEGVKEAGKFEKFFRDHSTLVSLKAERLYNKVLSAPSVRRIGIDE